MTDVTPEGETPSATGFPRWANGDGWGFVPGPDGHYPPHRDICFGCGPDNPVGLQLRITAGDPADGGPAGDGTGVIEADYRFPERFEGGPGVVHGGAIAAVFDDLLGTVSMALGQPAVTGKLSVNFRRPVLIGHQVALRAWRDKVSGRKIVVRAEMRDALDRVVADAEALMVAIETGHFQRYAADLPPGEEVPDGFRPFVDGENYP